MGHVRPHRSRCSAELEEHADGEEVRHRHCRGLRPARNRLAGPTEDGGWCEGEQGEAGLGTRRLSSRL